MDLVAGLHWLRENLPAFGGDPEKITLMGHGTGAAIANFIAVSPVAKGSQPASTTFRPTVQTSPTPLPPKSDTALQATTTTECPPNSTDNDANRNANSNNLLRRLARSHYQSYTTALTVTIAVGCFLLLLNILIFARIYHQRDRELLHRAILLSGSGLSPWALQRDPLSVKRIVAVETGCHGDLLEDDIAPCLRTKPLHQLLSVHINPPRFLPGFAPFVDGTVLLNPANFHGAMGPQQGSAVSTSAGFELADFPERDLLFGLTSIESYLDLNSQDLLYGFNDTRKDRILRTYVRNSYYYHLNEIFSTLKNEYTDWEKPTQSPLSVRDATLEVLSDGHTAAPLIRVGYLHAMRGGKTFFLHFLHQTDDKDFPQISGSVRGEDIPYVFGLPLVGGQPFFPHNYTHGDQQISKLLMHYIGNFARKGDPNGASPTASPSEATVGQKASSENTGSLPNAPFWDTYDTINQLYMEIGSKAETRNHYRGHKMSLWLNLIPQLHRPGEDDDMSMKHHHFKEEGAQYYDGSVRPQSMLKPQLIHMIGPPPASTTFRPTVQTSPTPLPPKSDTALQATTTTECPPNSTDNDANRNANSNNLLRRLASSHYQSYTTALTVTIAVGCFLLLLNILIFAGIYHQRDRGRNQFGDKKKEELAEAGSCSSSSNEAYDIKTSNPHKYECKAAYELSRVGSFECKSSYAEFAYEKRQLVERQLSELPLQEFKCSPPSGVKRQNEMIRPPSYSSDVASVSAVSESQTITSPSIPEPPPPPKAQAPTGNQTGILRSQQAPTTPGTMKKRVQIQEISV